MRIIHVRPVILPMCGIILIKMIFSVAAYGSKMGPYDIVFRHFDVCPDPGTRELVQTFKVRKFNRTVTVVDANMTVLTDLDDHVSMTVELAQFTNGGYKNKFFYKEFPKVCKTFLSSFNFVKEAYRAAKIDGCPIRKGEYSVANFTSRDTLELLPVFFYSKYRGEVVYYKRNHVIGCLRGFVEFIPKKKASKTG